jgi:hypothetical protein
VFLTVNRNVLPGINCLQSLIGASEDAIPSPAIWVSVVAATRFSTEQNAMLRIDAQFNLRSWCISHLATIIVLSSLGVALAYAQLESSCTGEAGGISSSRAFYHQGWPCAVRRIVVVDSLVFDPASQVYEFTSASTTANWYPLSVFLNVAFSLAVLLSTAVLCERWRRRSRPWQFTLHSYVTLVFVVGACAWLYRNESTIHWWWYSAPGYSAPLSYPLFYGLPLFVVVLVVFGIGCAVFMIGWMAVAVASKCLRKLIALWRFFQRTLLGEHW